MFLYLRQILILNNKKVSKSSFISDFKKFAMKGNVIDMAVGVIIGGAFGKIVTSVVNDIIMPPIGVLVGGMNFKDLKLVIKPEILGADGAVEQAAVTLNYGNFLQQTFDFLIIAFSIFVVIRVITNLTKKKEQEAAAAPAPAPAPEPSAEEKLLTEIRDLLKEKK